MFSFSSCFFVHFWAQFKWCCYIVGAYNSVNNSQLSFFPFIADQFFSLPIALNCMYMRFVAVIVVYDFLSLLFLHTMLFEFVVVLRAFLCLWSCVRACIWDEQPNGRTVRWVVGRSCTHLRAFPWPPNHFLIFYFPLRSFRISFYPKDICRFVPWYMNFSALLCSLASFRFKPLNPGHIHHRNKSNVCLCLC